jgi:hypothetical protein
MGAFDACTDVTETKFRQSVLEMGHPELGFPKALEQGVKVAQSLSLKEYPVNRFRTERRLDHGLMLT